MSAGPYSAGPTDHDTAATIGTLTEHERDSLSVELNLADGHADQETTEDFNDIIESLPTLWHESDATSIIDSEQCFRAAFADLAGSPGMIASEHFMVCPSASVSVDIVGAVLGTLGKSASLIEPTFDNIALLLRRRGVHLLPVNETDVYVGDPSFIKSQPTSALFLVQPNNPTGACMSSAQLGTIAIACRDAGKIMVLDNSFRFYNRRPFDDYAVLDESGVSYLALEDTGKVWPTHDLKASLLFCSPDLAALTQAIYSELFLSCSPFGLRVLERFVRRTSERGLRAIVWDVVDQRRALLRHTMAQTLLSCDPAAAASEMPVEWLDCSRMEREDVEVVRVAAAGGVRMLPGRHFFWHSAAERRCQFRVRVAMMKPAERFARSVAALAAIATMNKP